MSKGQRRTKARHPEAELKASVEQLIAELNGLSYEDDYERFDDIVSELVNYGAVLKGRLIEMASSLAYQERRAAVEALGRLGFDERRAVIIERLTDANWKVRHSAAAAIIHHPFDEVIPQLLELVGDEHRELRLVVIEALGRLRATDACRPLELALSDSDWRVRQDGAIALGRIGAPRAFAPLLLRLTDEDEDVRHASLVALSTLIGRVTDRGVAQGVGDLAEADRKTIHAALNSESKTEGLSRVIDELERLSSTAIDEEELTPYGRVMTADDQVGLLDEAFDRAKDVDNLMSLLLEDSHSSVILVGAAGVGKTTLIHQIARRAREMTPPYAVLETSTPELMVGTKYIGEWETKLRSLVEKIKRPRRVILYLTNVNDLPSAGTTSSNKQNFVALLAPYMRRGEITVVGESSVEALRSGIDNDLSVVRLFSKVKVAEPDRPTVLRILRQVLAQASASNDVELTMAPDVLELLVELSGTYYSTMAQPGRSVTVLRQVIDHVLKRSPDVPCIEIAARDIIGGLARFTGLPELLLDDEIPLVPGQVRAFFEERVLGQPEAVDAIVDLITLIKAGLNDPTKPLGVFLFVGPTGVGKTELAKCLAEFIFGSATRLTRFDLSEYKDYHSFEKLIGGTYRNEEKGQLTGKVREQPFSVVLLDEIEKAHANIFDLFLQVFDEGRLTDGRGRTTDFRHTILIMTSNIASSHRSGGQMGFGDDGDGGLASAKGVLREVERFFRPEFLNRIDRTVVFRALDPEAIKRITLRELGKVLVRSGLLRRRLVVDIDDSVIDHLRSLVFSKALGARPLKRAVEKQVLLPVAREIVSRGVGHEGDLLKVATDAEGEIAVVRVSSTLNQRRLAIVTGGKPALRGGPLRPLANRVRSRREARRRIEDVNAVLEGLALDSSGQQLDRKIERLEEAVSTVAFWDDPTAAQATLRELAHTKVVRDTLTGVLAWPRRLRSALDDGVSLPQWHATLLQWLGEIAWLGELTRPHDP